MLKNPPRLLYKIWNFHLKSLGFFLLFPKIYNICCIVDGKILSTLIDEK